MAFVANAVSLITYFYGYINFGLKDSATSLTNFTGAAYILTLVGAFISDTYMSRFTTCVLFASIELLGYALLTVQACSQQLRPFPRMDLPLSQMEQSEPADAGQKAILYAGLYLVALGTGGVKAALPILGAEQFDVNDPKEAARVSSFFNWFVFSLVIGAIFGVTFVVWISTFKGWSWGFGVCTIAILLSIVMLCIGKPFYKDNSMPKESPLLRITQVIVVSVQKRKLPIPENDDELYEIRDKVGANYEILQRTSQFRFLDRAAVVKKINGSQVATTTVNGSWSLCTITQVEETKILIRMLPIILSTVFMNTCLAQLQTFSIYQGTTMDPYMMGFKVPIPSIPVIPLIFMFFFIPLYDRIFVPIARKITGIPTGIRHLQRVGIGLVLSAISMAVAGFVETHRKNVAVQHDMVESREHLPMSMFWLGSQYAIFGVADMFTLVGLMEFFYEQSSASMKSLSTSISWCSLAFGYFTSTVMVEVVNKVSGGWLARDNLNKDHLNYFYWLLSLLSVINFGVYLVFASWYRYKTVEVKQGDEEVKSKEVKQSDG
uniref:Dicarboxylate transporter n=1 Tax=Datisca glomerata TaxID=34297 RepID=H6SWQ4_DATGL|nr:dicarboxylate transporter [Datisca glomerata]